MKDVYPVSTNDMFTCTSVKYLSTEKIYNRAGDRKKGSDAVVLCENNNV